MSSAKPCLLAVHSSFRSELFIQEHTAVCTQPVHELPVLAKEFLLRVENFGGQSVVSGKSTTSAFQWMAQVYEYNEEDANWIW